MSTDRFQLRIALPEDIDQIVDVCAAALGWNDPDFDRTLFRWKHLDNPFGASMIFVAEDDEGIAAVRPFMNWRFSNGTQPALSPLRAVRAVDTATHPRAQGQGLFRALTEMGLAELTQQQTAFVFNTPNTKSLRGYLSMGWIDGGQIELGYRVRSPLAIPRLVRARTAAAKRSVPTPQIGLDVEEGLSLADPRIVSRDEGQAGYTTAHSIESLRWRYAQAPMTYRFLAGPDGGGLIVRLRRRGAASELVVVDRIGPIDDAVAGRAVRNAMARTRATHCVGWKGLGGTISTRRLGPTLALRSLAEDPTAEDFCWLPGDIELF